MKKILLLVIVIFSIKNSSYCQDTINWRPGYKLTWNDFKGVPDSNTYYISETSSGVRYGYTATDTGLSYTVTCFFDKKKSWKKNAGSEVLLVHERGHFDISEIFAQKLRLAFAAYKPVKDSIGPDLKKIFRDVMQQRAKMQMQYEKETLYSRDQEMQEVWLAKIKKELDKTRNQ